MTFEEIYSVDKSNMYNLIKDFPNQVRDAVAIGKSLKLRMKARQLENIVLTGLGGSAIGGDLLRSYLAGELKIPFFVNRNYTLPKFVGPNTLVIVSSYSGNTEETNAAHKEAMRRRAKVLCISSNGVTEKLAKSKRTPFIKIPGGLPPRAALGFSFFPLLIALSKIKLITPKSKDVNETITLLQEKADEYAAPDPAGNRALQLAERLRGRLGVVYSSTERFDAVSTRWRGQIAENAKTLVFNHVLPEMNHNELVGWKVLKDQLREMQVLFFRDKDDHKRIQRRMDITKHVIGEVTGHIDEVWGEGRSTLARIFSLVYLGDWVSYYLAILNGEDPTPVKVIDYLKEELAKVK